MAWNVHLPRTCGNNSFRKQLASAAVLNLPAWSLRINFISVSPRIKRSCFFGSYYVYLHFLAKIRVSLLASTGQVPLAKAAVSVIQNLWIWRSSIALNIGLYTGALAVIVLALRIRKSPISLANTFDAQVEVLEFEWNLMVLNRSCQQSKGRQMSKVLKTPRTLTVFTGLKIPQLNHRIVLIPGSNSSSWLQQNFGLHTNWLLAPIKPLLFSSLN